LKAAKRLDAFIKSRKADRGHHYQTPPWFKDDLTTLKAVAAIYSQTGDKPFGWDRLRFCVPLSEVQTLYRMPRGPVAANYGHTQGYYHGRDWTSLVAAAKASKGWLGDGPLWISVDKGGRIYVAEGNHRAQALTEAFGKSRTVMVPIEIGSFSSRKAKATGRYYVIPASARPGQFTVSPTSPKGAHSLRLRRRKANKKRAAAQKEASERKKESAARKKTTDAMMRDIFGDMW
jgi:hypothetical protein